MRNKNMKNDNEGLVKVPESVLREMCCDMTMLFNMHQELIGLYEEESIRKKRHRAYLHIREYAEKLCEADKQFMDQVIDRWDNRKIVCEVEGCEREKSPSKSSSEDGEKDVFNLPEGLVVMPTESLDTMQSDMLMLTDTIDGVVAVVREMMKRRKVSDERISFILSDAAQLAEIVFQRWDSAEIRELN